MNLLYKDSNTGGALWQGDKDDAADHEMLRANKIKLVIFAAAQNQPKMPLDFKIIRARIQDDPKMDPRLAEACAECAREVAVLVERFVRRGNGVVSSCFKGWNRSGLLSSFALLRMTKATPDQIIKAIRTARGPYAMSNPIFERLVRNEGKKR